MFLRPMLHPTLLFLSCALFGCSATTLDTQPAPIGTPTTWDAMTAAIERPGPVEFEKHLAARWKVDLSGLVNLDHPKARSAQLADRAEPIEIYVYTLRHPTHGTFLIDSGVSESWRDPAHNPDTAWLIKRAMNTDDLSIATTTAQIVESLEDVPAGVLLTHLHLDHVMGVADVVAGTPVYVGPDESRASGFQNLFTRGTTDRLLANAKVLNEWGFNADGVIDVFGDGSLFAIHSPGHTPGSTAFLVLTTRGPQLVTGDVCHTAWGWKNGVEPGTFSADGPRSVPSLLRLIELVNDHPQITVHPGHQSLLPEHEVAHLQ